jgi:hypothetical protein
VFLQAVQRSQSRAASKASVRSSGAVPAARIRVKAIVNIGRVELEMMRNLPEHRTIEPLARFQVICRSASCADIFCGCSGPSGVASIAILFASHFG